MDNSSVAGQARIARSGSLVWQFATDAPIRAAPTVVDGTIFFGGTDGRLYALDSVTGAEHWRYDAGAPLGGAPLVTADRVVFSDRANRVHAIDRATGAPEWRLDTGPDLPLKWGHEGWDYVLPSPVLAAGTVLVGSGDGHLYAIELATGRARWRFATAGRVRGSAAVHDGVAWFGSGDGLLYGVSIQDGHEVRRFVTAGVTMDAAQFSFDRTQIQASPIIRDGVLYLGSRDASLYALDLDTLEPRWTIEDGTAWVVGPVAVHDGRVFVGRSGSGMVTAADAATGEQLWAVRAGGPVFGAPVVSEGTVYVASGGGRLLAIDAEDGTEQWSYALGGGSYGTPAVADGRVWVGSDEGHLYAFRMAEGSAPQAAVYWDDAMMPTSVIGGAEPHRAMATYFARRGWEQLDTAALRSFLETRIADRVPSVVVFAMDGLPMTVASAEAGPASLLRRYLEAGGKAVWLGRPPLIHVRDNEGQAVAIDRTLPSRLLGVNLSAWNGDLYGVSPTAAGRRQGLETFWVGEPWLAAANAEADGVVPLAVDELGRFSAWSKSFGGGGASGFVVLRGSLRTDLLEEIRHVAEYGVLRDPADRAR
jgi:eukaryotic-like serine/threonine-protein kinase